MPLALTNTSNTFLQWLSKDLETGCPDLAIVKYPGHQLFHRKTKYIQITIINMYLLTQKRYNILLNAMPYESYLGENIQIYK